MSKIISNKKPFHVIRCARMEFTQDEWAEYLDAVYHGNREHNARTSPAEKLRAMIEDEIKRLTRPQVVQLELFNF